MATNDYLEFLKAGGRQQLKTLSDIPSDESELTQAQYQQMIAEIDVMIFNILRARRGRLDPYTIGGSGGRRIDPAKGIEMLRKERDYLYQKLQQVPAIARTIYDDPDI